MPSGPALHPWDEGTLSWFPKSRKRGQVLSSGLGCGAVPELEHPLRVLQVGIAVGRVGRVTPALE